MRTSRIFVDCQLSEGQITTLNESTSHYLSRVLRVQTGQPVTLFNGDGFDYPAYINKASKKSVDVEIEAKVIGITDSSLNTHIGQVMSKGDRMDFMVQKATELGVNSITPLTSQYCDVKLNHERQEKRLQHWRQIAIHASEQSGRSTIPTINPITSLGEWVQQRDEDLKLTLHPRGAKKLSQFSPPESVALLIGPEGGLSEQEVDFAVSQKFDTTLLGPRVLRTETAPIVALSAVQLMWGDIGPL